MGASHHEANRNQRVFAFVVLIGAPVGDAAVVEMHQRPGPAGNPEGQPLAHLLSHRPLGEAQRLDRTADVLERIHLLGWCAQVDACHPRGLPHQVQQPRLMDQIAATIVPEIQPPDQQGVVGQINHRPRSVELENLALTRLTEGRGSSFAAGGGGHGDVGDWV